MATNDDNNDLDQVMNDATSLAIGMVDGTSNEPVTSPQTGRLNADLTERYRSPGGAVQIGTTKDGDPLYMTRDGVIAATSQNGVAVPHGETVYEVTMPDGTMYRVTDMNKAVDMAQQGATLQEVDGNIGSVGVTRLDTRAEDLNWRPQEGRLDNDMDNRYRSRGGAVQIGTTRNGQPLYLTEDGTIAATSRNGVATPYGEAVYDITLADGTTLRGVTDMAYARRLAGEGATLTEVGSGAGAGGPSRGVLDTSTQAADERPRSGRLSTDMDDRARSPGGAIQVGTARDGRPLWMSGDTLAVTSRNGVAVAHGETTYDITHPDGTVERGVTDMNKALEAAQNGATLTEVSGGGTTGTGSSGSGSGTGTTTVTSERPDRPQTGRLDADLDDRYRSPGGAVQIGTTRNGQPLYMTEDGTIAATSRNGVAVAHGETTYDITMPDGTVRRGVTDMNFARRAAEQGATLTEVGGGAGAGPASTGVVDTSTQTPTDRPQTGRLSTDMDDRARSPGGAIQVGTARDGRPLWMSGDTLAVTSRNGVAVAHGETTYDVTMSDGSVRRVTDMAEALRLAQSGATLTEVAPGAAAPSSGGSGSGTTTAPVVTTTTTEPTRTPEPARPSGGNNTLQQIHEARQRDAGVNAYFTAVQNQQQAANAAMQQYQNLQRWQAAGGGGVTQAQIDTAARNAWNAQVNLNKLTGQGGGTTSGNNDGSLPVNVSGYGGRRGR